jgi:hypothetical protein
MLQRRHRWLEGKHLPSKRNVRNSFRTATVEAISQRDEDDWSVAVAEALHRIAAAVRLRILRHLRTLGRRSLVRGEAVASPPTSRRPVFESWVDGKRDTDARAATLAEAQQAMDQLHSGDLDAVRTASRDAIKKLSKSAHGPSTPSQGGIGLGVLTGGLAAPAIAGAYGTCMACGTRTHNPRIKSASAARLLVAKYFDPP